MITGKFAILILALAIIVALALIFPAETSM